jgi:hypothetical protein
VLGVFIMGSLGGSGAQAVIRRATRQIQVERRRAWCVGFVVVMAIELVLVGGPIMSQAHLGSDIRWSRYDHASARRRAETRRMAVRSGLQ